MSDTNPYTMPDDIVAEKIVKRFVDTGLLPKVYANEAKRLLANGTVKAEDWRLLVEKAIELETLEG